ncbi:MAG: hypothetical protein ACREQ3_14830 [Candidatus Binatia bacterium]
MTVATTGNQYLDVYQRMLDHQREHDGLLIHPLPGRPEQPHWLCLKCVREQRVETDGSELRKRYSYAVPSEPALDTIIAHSPTGVVEIGAGSGYWAMLLQRRGVDVVAYDPEPPGHLRRHWYRRPGGLSNLAMCQELPTWHSGKAWTAVHEGDHTKAAEHPTRTLLMCWPSYDEPWAAWAVECYMGDTVIYVGEGSHGCTADDRFHALVGDRPYCRHYDNDGNEASCEPDCPSLLPPLFAEVAEVEIPQWSGLHDRLVVYRRLDSIR